MIEEGEYVRTKSGLIDRIAYITDTMGDRKLVGFEKSNYCRSDLGIEKDIVKHSKNIIDLVEVGDIVNNGYIYEIGNTEDGHKWIHNLNGLLLFEDDIKTILTKEQYMQNCYKLVDRPADS